jgi:hypothetical protein
MTPFPSLDPISLSPDESVAPLLTSHFSLGRRPTSPKGLVYLSLQNDHSVLNLLIDDLPHSDLRLLFPKECPIQSLRSISYTLETAPFRALEQVDESATIINITT